MDPIVLAKTIADGSPGDPLPEAAADWLRIGLKRFLCGACDTLEVALRLTGANRAAARDRALLGAAALLAAPGEPPWRLAQRLEYAIRRFEADTLPLIRRGDKRSLSALDNALLAAFQAGARPLRSARRLYDLLLTNSR